MLSIKVIVGVVVNVLAQLCVKKSTMYDFLSNKWLIMMSIAIVLYGISFLIYSFILRDAPLNIISPVMSISGMLLIVMTSSIIFVEPVSFRQFVGLVLGMISIILLVK